MNAATVIDVYALVGNMKRFLPILAVLGLVCGVMYGPPIVAGLIGSALISGAMVISAGTDDSASWESFRASLPISRRQIVNGRYLALLAMAVLVFALTVAVSWIAMVAQWQLSDPTVVPVDKAAELLGALEGVATTYCAMMIVTAAVIPVLLRYGMAGSLRFIVLGACAFVICIGIAFSEDIPGTAALPAWLADVSPLAVMAALTAIAWLASYLIAQAWYARKEF